jgi:ankyrin repeat protein
VAAEYGGRGNNTIETLRLLINAKADLTARNSYGVTALGGAVKKRKSDVIDFLTSLGARM